MDLEKPEKGEHEDEKDYYEEKDDQTTTGSPSSKPAGLQFSTKRMSHQFSPIDITLESGLDMAGQGSQPNTTDVLRSTTPPLMHSVSYSVETQEMRRRKFSTGSSPDEFDSSIHPEVKLTPTVSKGT